jgi:hypothetical protein
MGLPSEKLKRSLIQGEKGSSFYYSLIFGVNLPKMEMDKNLS